MNIFDWIDTLSKPLDDSSLTKELNRWNQINESLKRGDYTVKIDPQNSPIAHIEQTLEAINEKLEIEHQARLEADKTARKQAVTDRNRFIFNTVIGIVSAVAAVIGAVFAAVSFFS